MLKLWTSDLTLRRFSVSQKLSRAATVLLLSSGLGLGATPGLAQLAPTAAYARGQDVDPALIIQEWKSRMPDIPVFSCTCQAATCDTNPRWPFRSFSRFQQLVALGPFNAAYNESQGFQCFDLATGVSPTAAAEPDEPVLRVELEEGGRSLRISRNGTSRTFNASDFNLNIIDAVDCASLSVVPQKQFSARFLTGHIAIDPETERIAVGAVLDECVEVQQSAIFVLEPQGSGTDTFAFYRLSVPGAQGLPDGFSSYALSSLSGLDFFDGNWIVSHGTAAENRALLVFGPGNTPAGDYLGCVELAEGENPAGICPQTSP